MLLMSLYTSQTGHPAFLPSYQRCLQAILVVFNVVRGASHFICLAHWMTIWTSEMTRKASQMTWEGYEMAREASEMAREASEMAREASEMAREASKIA